MVINWKIINLKRKLESGIVFDVVYMIQSEKDGITDRIIGSLPLSGNDNSPDFIKYEDLTEQIVINWVKSTLGEIKVSEIENKLKSTIEARIEKLNNQTIADGTPWSNQDM
jgi:hypothetical protein